MDVDFTASVRYLTQPCSLAVGLRGGPPQARPGVARHANVSGQRARSSGSLTPELGRQVSQPQPSPKYAPFVHARGARSHIPPSGSMVRVSVAASSSPVAPTPMCL